MRPGCFLQGEHFVRRHINGMILNNRDGFLQQVGGCITGMVSSQIPTTNVNNRVEVFERPLPTEQTGITHNSTPLQHRK